MFIQQQEEKWHLACTHLACQDTEVELALLATRIHELVDCGILVNLDLKNESDVYLDVT